MCEARATILRLGGIPKCNTFSKLYLALMGVFPWKYLPAIPAELVLLPDWLYFNIYQMSSWTRAMMMPLAIINHFKPTRTPPRISSSTSCIRAGWKAAISRCRARSGSSPGAISSCGATPILKWIDNLRLASLPRPRPGEQAEAWMVERMGEGSDGLAAIFPAMLNALIALEALGYEEDHPGFPEGTEGFRGSVRR